MSTLHVALRTLTSGFCVVASLGLSMVRAQFDCSGVTTHTGATVKSFTVATGISYPVFITAPPNDRERIFIVSQQGRIYVKQRGSDPATQSVFLDISNRTAQPPACDECGLLGLAFDPDFANNGLFYINFTEAGSPLTTTVSRWSVAAGNPNQADPSSELRLLRIAQPENNHNGGWIAFGPDGYLYVATGDGGGSGDQHGACGNGQSTTTLLGKILRIDPANNPANRVADCGGTTNYRIPADNPLVGTGVSNCEEIYAWGMRNPWRNAFDPVNGDIYIADVGQFCYEEVNYATLGGAKGKNYGWREKEGRNCFNSANPLNCSNAAPSTGCPTNCLDPSLTDPLFSYGHGAGCSITGGIVYRGCQLPNLRGRYFYGDYCDGYVKSFVVSGGAVTNQQDWTSQLDPSGQLEGSLTSFGSDAEGELYMTDRDGSVLRASPPFTELEVSGVGALPAEQLRLGPSGWTWQNLQRASWHPVTQYRVYRSASPIGIFVCVFKSTGTTWLAGDSTNPPIGAALYYLVVATSPAGELTRATATPRVLAPAACP